MSGVASPPLPSDLRAWLEQIARRALRVGTLALVLLLAVGFFSGPWFFRAWLVGWMFWMGVGAGSTVILMINYTAGGEWGHPVRRVLEAAASTVPWTALLIVPVFLGIGVLYPWARVDEVARSPLLQHKAVFLNVPFFIVRSLLYLASFSVTARVLRRWSMALDASGDLAVAARIQRFSAGGLVLFAGTVTFASIDWVMSLEPEWFSTAYGVIWMIAWPMSSLAFAILAVLRIEDVSPGCTGLRVRDRYQLGQLTMVFIMLLAYVSFGQFVIIWCGNLPYEIPWVLRRMQGGWEWPGLLVLLAQLFLPFCMLLFGHVKRRADLLRLVAGIVFWLQFLHVFWLIAPAFSSMDTAWLWLDVLPFLAIGGFWMTGFARSLLTRPLVPGLDAALDTPGRPLEVSLGHA